MVWSKKRIVIVASNKGSAVSKPLYSLFWQPSTTTARDGTGELFWLELVIYCKVSPLSVQELKNLIPKSAVGTLSANSSNVINLIIDAYNVSHLESFVQLDHNRALNTLSQLSHLKEKKNSHKKFSLMLLSKAFVCHIRSKHGNRMLTFVWSWFIFLFYFFLSGSRFPLRSFWKTASFQKEWP